MNIVILLIKTHHIACNFPFFIRAYHSHSGAGDYKASYALAHVGLAIKTHPPTNSKRPAGGTAPPTAVRAIGRREPVHVLELALTRCTYT